MPPPLPLLQPLLRCAVAASAVWVPALAHAATLPEPLIGETITDIDGVEAGELEVDFNGGLSLVPRGRQQLTVEAEWRPLRRMGVTAEFGAAQGLALLGRAGLSWAWHPAENWHLQAEAVWHGDVLGVAADLPGDARQPWYAGLRAGGWAGALAVRAGAGVSAGGVSARAVPAYATLALLLPLAVGEESAAGLETEADWARVHVWVFAPHFTLGWSGGDWRLQCSLPLSGDGIGLMVRLLRQMDR